MKLHHLTLSLITLGALTLATLPTQAADEKAKATSGALAKKDEAFVKKAAIGGMAEVELGKLAQQKATKPEVKAFGQMMVTDHSKANEDLKSVAAKKGVALPADLDAKHKATAEKLSKLEGEKFDAAYVDEMLSDHKKDVAEFEAAAKSAEDPDLKAFIERTLPTLRKHLDHVKGLTAKK